ncbi:MAG TPA: hypothetical protein VGM43_19785, partial [Bryobacteraceae bacterium]
MNALRWVETLSISSEMSGIAKWEIRIGDRMRAWRFSRAFGLEHIENVELPEPTPGPGQAVVR